MKILDLYIAKTLLKYSLAVMVILVGVFAFFKFLEEVDDIGRVGYSAIDAFAYVSMLIPSIAHSLSSLFILLGVILGLGYLASNSELVVMRSASVSIGKITKTSLQVSLILMIVMMLFGEFIAPFASEQAKRFKAKATGERIVDASEQGFWIREGEQFIHVDKNVGGEFFKNVTLINRKNKKEIDSVVFSPNAVIDQQNLYLKQSSSYQLAGDDVNRSITKESLPEYTTLVNFDQDLIQSLKKEPKTLSIWQLYKHIDFLSSNQLSTDIYEVEFYARLMQPITLVTMIVLAIPFVFGSLRDSSLGKKVFIGVTIGLFFWLASKIGAQLSLRFDFNHLISAALPTIVVSVFAIFNLYRMSLR